MAAQDRASQNSGTLVIGNTTQRPQFEDPMNPFYIHHSDNPGAVIVSQLLIGENYPSWSRSMFMALSMKNKLSFVDGMRGNVWKRCNNAVMGWIINAVTKEIAASIQFGDSA